MTYVIHEIAVHTDRFATICAVVGLFETMLITVALSVLLPPEQSFVLFEPVSYPLLFFHWFFAYGAVGLFQIFVSTLCANDGLAALWTKPHSIKDLLKADSALRVSSTPVHLFALRLTLGLLAYRPRICLSCLNLLHVLACSK